ncbi:MAG: sarcosine oxidase subunit gamma [Paracoccaceae bacterium]
MPEIIAKLPLGLAPVTHGGVTLAELPLPRVTSVAPFQGQDKAIAKALKTMGLSFPAPNQVSTSKGTGTLIWTARNQAFLLDADPAPLTSIAALTDQSDGWCALTLAGPQAADVLARLIPIDLRPAHFPPGQTARTALNHMNLILWRTGPDAFTLMVFRSMARTAWHELTEAMQALAARQTC